MHKLHKQGHMKNTALLSICIFSTILQLNAIGASDVAVAVPPLMAVAQLEQKNKIASASKADATYKPKSYDPIVFLAEHEKPIACGEPIIPSKTNTPLEPAFYMHKHNCLP